jgi:hypothetical protein
LSCIISYSYTFFILYSPGNSGICAREITSHSCTIAVLNAVNKRITHTHTHTKIWWLIANKEQKTQTFSPRFSLSAATASLSLSLSLSLPVQQLPPPRFSPALPVAASVSSFFCFFIAARYL